MKEHLILFNAEMVKAILGGRKTMTRRLMKPQPVFEGDGGCWYPSKPEDIWDDKEPGIWYGSEASFKKYAHETFPKHQIGDILAIHEVIGREPCPACSEKPPNPLEGIPGVVFKDVTPHIEGCDDGWVVKTRDTGERREVTAIRCERVRSISHEDAEAEGLSPWADNKSFELRDQRLSMAQLAFSYLIDEIYPGSWEQNQFVWVYEFKVVPNG